MSTMIAAVLGWVGTIGLLATYILASRGRLAVTSLKYVSMNAVGGVLAGTASALYGAWPGAASNYVWALVAVHTLGTCLRGRMAQSRSLTAMSVVDEAEGIAVGSGTKPVQLAAQVC